MKPLTSILIGLVLLGCVSHGDPQQRAQRELDDVRDLSAVATLGVLASIGGPEQRNELGAMAHVVADAIRDDLDAPDGTVSLATIGTFAAAKMSGADAFRRQEVVTIFSVAARIAERRIDPGVTTDDRSRALLRAAAVGILDATAAYAPREGEQQ